MATQVVPDYMKSYTGGDGKTLAQYQGDQSALQKEIARANSVGSDAAKQWASQLQQYAYQPPAQPAQTNTGTPSSYVKSPTVDAMGRDDQLAYYGSHADELQNEILRAKGVYDSNPSNGAGAHEWADLLRAQATKSGINLDSAYMNNPDSPAGAPMQIPANTNVTQKPSRTNGLFDLWMNSQNIDTAGLHSQAGKLADNIIKQKQDSLNSARKGIDDNYFKQYLQGRQNMANRGLGSSGLAADGDYRLQLAKQGDLADLYSKFGSFDKASVESDEYDKLFSSANKSAIDKANMIQKMYDSNLPYDQLTQKDQYDAINNQDKNAIEETKNNHNYEIEKAKIGIELKKFGLDVTKVMGFDPQTGQPTLDGAKLLEDVRHNMVGEKETAYNHRASEATANYNAATNAQNASTNYANAETNRARLAADIDKEFSQIGLDRQKLVSANMGKQADMFYNVAQNAKAKLDSASKEKSQYLSNFQYGGKPDKSMLDAFDARISDSAKEIDAASSSMKIAMSSNSGNPSFE